MPIAFFATAVLPSIGTLGAPRVGMSNLRGANGPVRIDPVGGTTLPARADLHRDGLIFPPFPYSRENPKIRDSRPVWGKGEIETEGSE